MNVIGKWDWGLSVTKNKNIERHTVHTTVSWPNPKQWIIVHTNILMMIIRWNIYILSIITREMGKLKTHSPIYCTIAWENMLKLYSLRTWSTLVQVMPCCLTAPSHYLNQCWLVISKVPWHLFDGIIIERFEDTNQWDKIAFLKLHPDLPGINELRQISEGYPGVYTKFSGRLSKEPLPWLIQKFPCILIFYTGQPGCQFNLSEGQIRLDLTSGRPLV